MQIKFLVNVNLKDYSPIVYIINIRILLQSHQTHCSEMIDIN